MQHQSDRVGPDATATQLEHVLRRDTAQTNVQIVQSMRSFPYHHLPRDACCPTQDNINIRPNCTRDVERSYSWVGMTAYGHRGVKTD